MSTPISGLDLAALINSADQVAIEQAGETKRAPLGDIFAALGGGEVITNSNGTAVRFSNGIVMQAGQTDTAGFKFSEAESVTGAQITSTAGSATPLSISWPVSVDSVLFFSAAPRRFRSFGVVNVSTSSTGASFRVLSLDSYAGQTVSGEWFMLGTWS